MLQLSFLHGQTSHQPNNVITQPISSLPPSHPQRPSPKQPLGMPTYHMPNAQTPPLAQTQNTNQEMNFAAKKLVKFIPILVSYVDLLPYPLDNSMVAITPTKVPQPPFLRGYDSNVSYPNFIRGASIVGMRPSFDYFEVLGTHHWAIREVLWHVGSQKKALLHNP